MAYMSMSGTREGELGEQGALFSRGCPPGTKLGLRESGTQVDPGEPSQHFQYSVYLLLTQ